MALTLKMLARLILTPRLSLEGTKHCLINDMEDAKQAASDAHSLSNNTLPRFNCKLPQMPQASQLSQSTTVSSETLQTDYIFDSSALVLDRFTDRTSKNYLRADQDLTPNKKTIYLEIFKLNLAVDNN